jgi:hypothetical protein
MRRALPLLLLLSGCLDYSAVVDDVTDPGGAVKASMDAGRVAMTTALGNAKNDPLVVTGGSTELTFSLTAAADDGGTSARTLLAMPGGHATITLDPASSSHLEIHTGGSGCVAQHGTVHLSLDQSNQLDGDFSALGNVFGGTAGCRIDGTLAGVPVEH